MVAWLWGYTAGHDGCTEGENKAGKSGLCLVTADVHAMNGRRSATRSNASKQHSRWLQQFKQTSKQHLTTGQQGAHLAAPEGPQEIAG